MGRTLSTALLAGLAVLAGGGSAHASDITVERVNPICTGGDECRYFMEQPYDNHTLVGAPGEHNRITATRDAGVVVFRDDGAPIRDTGNCTRVDDHEVRCVSRYARADAGDMDDVVTVDGARGDGGAGDDELIGGPQPDFLTGGSGTDVLRGHGGKDYLTDGDAGADGDADVFDGGADGAEVEYTASAAPVRVDLGDAAANAGEAGENDRFVSITDIEGGTGDDDLRSAPAGSILSGGPGADTLTGGPGEDQIFGGEGANRIDAGPGRDSILVATSTGSGQRVMCGDGPDLVQIPGPRDLVGADCERIQFFSENAVTQLLPLRSLTASVVRVSAFSCFGRGNPGIELRVAGVYRRAGLPRAGTLLGRRTASRRACRGRPNLGVRLSRTGARLLRRHRTLPLEVRVIDPGDRARYVTELSAP